MKSIAFQILVQGEAGGGGGVFLLGLGLRVGLELG